MPFPEGARWLFERGLGEDRAALVAADGTLLEALRDPDTPRLKVGAVVEGRARRDGARWQLETALGDALVERPGPGWTEGATVRAEVVREALPERGTIKRAVARATHEPPAPAPTLAERLAATRVPVIETTRRGEDALEAAGWSRVLSEEAALLPIAFAGGTLHVEPTRAMTLIDVDGWLAPPALAVAGAEAAAAAIRRLGLAGAIGIDLPSVDGAARAAAAAAIDAALPPPFERTAVNGWGFVQVVRPRARPSLVEQVAADPAGVAARLLLRRAERSPLPGAHRLTAAPAVVAAIAARPDWLAALDRTLGGATLLCADPRRPIWQFDAEPV